MKTSVKIGLILVVCLVGLVLLAMLIRIGFSPKSGGNENGPALSLGKTETSCSLSSGSTTSSSDNSTFNSRRVLLVADNPHPLSRRIATLLAQNLKDCPQIEQLETVDSPARLMDGTEAPDLFIRLDLVDLKTEGILAVSGSIKATVCASLGSAPWESSSYTQDASTPPLVNFNWNATLEADSTFTGVRSDRYADTARRVADELAKAIGKQLEALNAKYPKLPELPAEFYGPYQAVTDFDFLKTAKARRVAAYCGLLTHNQTFWQFQTGTNPVPQLQQIITQLEAAGWKCSDSRITNTESYYIRCRQGAAELEIFRHRAEPMSWGAAAPTKKNADFIAHYRMPFSQPEREAALDRLFQGQPSIETLLPFRNSFSKSQRDNFYALVEKSPAVSPAACVQLADVYLSRKQTNAAVNLLLRAKALTATVKDPASLESNIEATAKRISPKHELKLAATAEICRDLGFLDVTNLPPTIEQERALGQSLVFFGPGKQGVKIYALTVQPPEKSAYPWFMVQTEDGMRSSSWSSFIPSTQGDWHHSFTCDQQTVNIVAVPLPDKKAVKFSIQLEPRK